MQNLVKLNLVKINHKTIKIVIINQEEVIVLQISKNSKNNKRMLIHTLNKICIKGINW